MRKTMFNDTIIESVDDDLGLVDAFQDAGDEIYAVIQRDTEDPSKFYFEVMENESGEAVASSDPIFGSVLDTRAYLRGWVKDIQEDLNRD